MKILELLRDYNVPFQTEGHKHCRPGWANMDCPFCTGNPGLHLGVSIDGAVFTCWRCGWKPTSKAIAKLIGVNEHQAKEIMTQYGGKSTMVESQLKRAPRKKSHRFPSDTGPMETRHKRYLQKRGFDPDYIEKRWGVLGTGPISKLDGVSYNHRLLAPIYWDGEQVSFQTRDITGRHPAKYMACPEEREKIKHKHILYGKQQAWSDTGICVEGITDVWRLGKPAFATLGIKFTKRQLRLIAQQFSRVIIIFDDDPQAVKQADELQNELLFRGLEVGIETLVGDPADLSEREARQLIKKIY